MDSTSNKPRRWTLNELDLVNVGQEIHEAVVDEGRREGVFAYLVRDGRRGWFEKYDRRTKELHRRFSPTLAERIKANRDALKLYVEYCNCQAPGAPGLGSDKRNEEQGRKGKGQRTLLTNEN